MMTIHEDGTSEKGNTRSIRHSGSQIFKSQNTGFNIIDEAKDHILHTKSEGENDEVTILNDEDNQFNNIGAPSLSKLEEEDQDLEVTQTNFNKKLYKKKTLDADEYDD